MIHKTFVDRNEESNENKVHNIVLYYQKPDKDFCTEKYIRTVRNKWCHGRWWIPLNCAIYSENPTILRVCEVQSACGKETQ